MFSPTQKKAVAEGVAETGGSLKKRKVGDVVLVVVVVVVVVVIRHR